MTGFEKAEVRSSIASTGMIKTVNLGIVYNENNHPPEGSHEKIYLLVR